MADDNRYGGYGSSYGRDDDRNRGYGSPGYGGYNDRDQDRHRGYGAYDQGGGYGQQSRYRDDDRQQSYGRGRDNDRYDNRDENRRVAIDETDRLIASNKVEGTRVYNRRGDRLGTIYNFMVDKRSGKVEYAVMSFGGFLGLGERYYPLPWNLLTYEEQHGGYVVDLDERQLERAPSFGRNDEPRFDRGYSMHVNDYYGVRY
jgi:sporulation protein YlmC with PRC-barrel domain